MKIELHVKMEVLNTLMIFAATADRRTYLNGICLQIGPKISHAVATDGNVIGVFRVYDEQPDIVDPIEVLIPAEVLKQIKFKGIVTVSIDTDDKSHGEIARPVVMSCGGVKAYGVSSNDKFPDWRRLFPHEAPSGKVSQFDAKILARLAKAWTVLHGSGSNHYVTIGHNGDAFVPFSLGDADFFGGLMPLRQPKTEKEPFISVAPDWVRQP